MRLVAQARTLYVGLLAVGTDDAAAVRIAARLALDCMPPVRRKLLGALLSPERANISELARRTGSHRHVVERTLEDLELLSSRASSAATPRTAGATGGCTSATPGSRATRSRGWHGGRTIPPPPSRERAHARVTHRQPSDDVVERLAEAFDATSSTRTMTRSGTSDERPTRRR